jgi:hypothetical protein
MARFARRYGFDWRLGPDDENAELCRNCQHQFCRPVGHFCVRAPQLQAPMSPDPGPPPDFDFGQAAP